MRPEIPEQHGKVYRRGECHGEEWTEFIKAMHSGKVFECDEEMYFYWLEVLPPIFMGGQINFLPGHEGHAMHVDFGFAEGAEPITVFWRSLDGKRFFGQRTKKINWRA